jgi:hypothetical protein
MTHYAPTQYCRFQEVSRHHPGRREADPPLLLWEKGKKAGNIQDRQFFRFRFSYLEDCVFKRKYVILRFGLIPLLGLEFIYWRLILYRSIVVTILLSLKASLLHFIKNEIEKMVLYFEIRWFCGLELYYIIVIKTR